MSHAGQCRIDVPGFLVTLSRTVSMFSIQELVEGWRESVQDHYFIQSF